MKGKYIAMLLILSMLTMTVAAAESVRYDPQSGVLTLSWDGLLEGSSYSFMAVAGTEDDYTIDGGNLLFISQPQADEEGKISLTFIKTLLPECVFLSGGTFPNGETSPRMLGGFIPPREEKKELHLPGALTAIGEEAFMDSDLDYVYLGTQVTEIGERAFMNCRRMRYIMIPAGVTSIGEDAFAGCSQLVIGCVEGSPAHAYAQANAIAFEYITE